VRDSLRAALKNGAYIVALKIIAEGKLVESEVEECLGELFSISRPPGCLRERRERRYIQIDSSVVYERLEKGKIASFRVSGLIDDVAGDDILSVNWAVYRRILSSNGKHKVIRAISHCLEDQKLLKELSVYALRMGPKLQDFKLYVGCELLYGYNYDAPTTDVTDKIMAWTDNDFIPNYLGSYDVFRQNYKVEMAALLKQMLGEKVIDEVDPVVFCTDIGQTGTSGSGYDPGGQQLEVKINKKQERTARNKYAKSMALSVDEKLSRLFGKKQQKNKVSVKVEPKPKVRLIVSGDYNTFLKMQYVDTWLDRLLKPSDMSTLWFSSELLERFWSEFSVMTGAWAIPIDQTAFDHHITKDDVLDFILICIMLTMKMQNINRVLESIHGGMIEAILIYGSRTFKYKSGLLSGWKWTAKLDSIINIVQGRLAKRILKELGIKIEPMLLFNVQGDDQEVRFRRKIDAMLYWLALSSMGYEIHPSKNFLSNEHDEYLRRVSIKGYGVTGYPARMVNKICWLYPGKEILRGTELMNMILDRWMKLGQRLDSNDDIIRSMIISDLTGAKIDVKLACEFFGTSVLNGGRGSYLFKFADKDNLFRVTAGEYRARVEIDGSGYRQAFAMFSEFQEREMKRWAESLIKLPPVVEGIRVQVDEKLIRGERRMITPLKFVVAQDVRVMMPGLIESWPYDCIFGKSRELMDKLFPGSNMFIEQHNAPRSWVYDLLTGSIKVSFDMQRGWSQEAVAMVMAKYMGSMFEAMLRKRSRDDKWISLVAYLNSMVPEILQNHSAKLTGKNMIL
jgi:hypothetical protein